jgi:SAM-dependent methyltransferase
MGTSASYDSIASLYDQHWGHDFAALATRAIDTHLLHKFPAGSRVLDLCCGTGLVLAHLHSLGFEACGVDESADMLAVARRHAPHAALLHADMADFSCHVQFDAAVSFYNSLNHARTLEHLQATFANLARHLKRDGLFLFDYVTPEAFESTWESREELASEDGTLTLHYSYQPSSGYATCQINDQESIRQISFTPLQVREGLKAAGMSVVFETSMPGANPTRGRRLVLSKKQ